MFGWQNKRNQLLPGTPSITYLLLKQRGAQKLQPATKENYELGIQSRKKPIKPSNFETFCSSVQGQRKETTVSQLIKVINLEFDTDDHLFSQ